MDRPKLEVADIFRRYGEAYRQQHGASLSTAQRRVMTSIELCRTAALGGHLERCDQCGHERNCFNSCRDRHCPKCQSLARAQWIEDRQTELLDCPYYHVVFTVPEEIAAIAYQNKKVVYGILFRTTAETLTTIAADPEHLGAEIGFFAPGAFDNGYSCGPQTAIHARRSSCLALTIIRVVKRKEEFVAIGIGDPDHVVAPPCLLGRHRAVRHLTAKLIDPIPVQFHEQTAFILAHRILAQDDFAPPHG